MTMEEKVMEAVNQFSGIIDGESEKGLQTIRQDINQVCRKLEVDGT